ncbi:hypothetical protein [Halocatena pleomorpha]|uniref:DUF7967 domain-containing protein n=1 Tax=Halocatena pleomorpha TaxID=1785090 RepID=A0A3P3RFK2_9EURY|nr:hypothetical protein EIK79_05405 [Halocatena pleomorpha]
MADDVRLWMVERSYDTRNLITVVYATTDGDRYHQKELSATMLSRTEVTAAVDLPRDTLEPVDDEQRRQRYATEATRMAETHAPDEAV